MINYLTRIWCWIVGHNWVCIKRHEVTVYDYPALLMSISVHRCTRCDEYHEDQWDE